MFSKTIKTINNISSIFVINFKQNYYFGQTVAGLKRQKEAKLAKKIRQALNPSYLSVTDTTMGSNSCGQMYQIVVESTLFNGKSKVAQHKMITDSINQQLKTIHGINIKTKIPSQNKQKKLQEQTLNQKQSQTKQTKQTKSTQKIHNQNSQKQIPK